MTRVAAPTSAPTTPAPRLAASSRRSIAVAVSMVAGGLVQAPLTRSPPIDLMIGALLGGVVAATASWARRGPLLTAATLAVLLLAASGADDAVRGVVVVAIAVAGALSTRHLRRRAPLARGLTRGAVATAFLVWLGADPVAPSAVIWIVAALVLGASGLHGAPRYHRAAAASIAVAVCLATGLAAVGGLVASRSVDRGLVELRRGLVAARAGDVGAAGQHFEVARSSMSRADRQVSRFGLFARVVPGVAQNVAALDRVLAAAADASGQAALTATAADVESLTVEDGRIDVDAMAALENPLRRLGHAFDAVDTAVRRSREDLLVPVIDRRLGSLAAQVAPARVDAIAAADAAAAVPDLLGASRPRRYLVLFTSPAEARGRFGFPGSFAEVRFDDGKMTLGEHGSVSRDLRTPDVDQSVFDLGDDGLAPYLAFGPTRTFLSATIPPDFETVAAVVSRLWESSDRAPLDGVLRFDPAALAALTRYTGPVSLPDVGQPLTASNLEDFLVTGQYLQFPDDRPRAVNCWSRSRRSPSNGSSPASSLRRGCWSTSSRPSWPVAISRLSHSTGRGTRCSALR